MGIYLNRKALPFAQGTEEVKKRGMEVEAMAVRKILSEIIESKGERKPESIKVTEQEMKEYLIYLRYFHPELIKDLPDGFPSADTPGYTLTFKGVTVPFKIVKPTLVFQ